MRTGLRQFLFTSMLILQLTAASGSTAFAKAIDPDEILFGIEYTFQDQEMVNEPGRNTTSTPYKQEKLKVFSRALIQQLELPETVIAEKTTWKPGININVPDDGAWVMNTEPVTIEVNTTPRHFADIHATAVPIYKAASKSNLVAYVNPAAERSGMGHVHIGGKTMATNPFYKNPLLLRNVMVYLHKNPALLFGFAEAYDMGLDSNIETYHGVERQKQFQKAVRDFDIWYGSASEQNRKEGLNQFLYFLELNDLDAGFFEHNRFVNLEHVGDGKTVPFLPTDEGQLTIEFRNFRPPKDADTAVAFASLLLAEMTYQARENHREPFQFITPGEYINFYSGTNLASNWLKVRKELSLNNPILDYEMRETVNTVQTYRYDVPSLKGAEVFNAFSQKERKGELLEVRLPRTPGEQPPVIISKNKQIMFIKADLDSKRYWITVVDTKDFTRSTKTFLEGRAKIQMIRPANSCQAIFR